MMRHWRWIAVALSLAAISVWRFFPTASETPSEPSQKAAEKSFVLSPFLCTENKRQTYSLNYLSEGSLQSDTKWSSHVKATAKLHVQCHADATTLNFESQLQELDLHDSEIMGQKLDPGRLSNPFRFSWSPKKGIHNIQIADVGQSKAMILVDMLNQLS
ncbi:hypothetical protein N9D31_03565, partial [Oligoflexaceae bacterium]|nr:hypothetical protein [Oligoflexaceae bacterium]